jgi:hypothetical protein
MNSGTLTQSIQWLRAEALGNHLLHINSGGVVWQAIG